ncbi:MAG: N-6 DNA methylase [Methylococcales bacterium]
MRISIRDEDIARIMGAVEKREEIEKFAYVATLAEIKENDFNLNIPRYVDTFEEEEAVDLGDVVEQLKSLEVDMADTDKTIAQFCVELGIDSPFEKKAV